MELSPAYGGSDDFDDGSPKVNRMFLLFTTRNLPSLSLSTELLRSGGLGGGSRHGSVGAS
jgi:hypothetical protein